MKAANTTLKVNMLGSCSLVCGDNIIDDQKIRSKKIWSVLQYLIVFRNRDISQPELFDLIDPEGKSDNPGNALKTLMHRIRAMLDELDFYNSKDMLLQHRGTYSWNNDMDFTVDADVFDSLCAKGKSPDYNPEEQLGFLLQAIDIFKGDFLPRFSLESWVIPLHTYYHTLFMEAVHAACQKLAEEGKYADVVKICRHAISIDPYDEFSYYNLISALAGMKNYQAALFQYKEMTDLFFNEFGVTPSKEMTALYKKIVQSSKSVEIDLTIIKDALNEESYDSGAFFCEYEVFKDIYRLNSRTFERTGQSAYICILTLDDQGEQLATKALTPLMTKLFDCVKASLRRGDVYARYSVSQYILMLPNTNFENGELVVKRIVRRFNKENPRHPGDLNYSILPLDILLKPQENR